MPAPLYSKNGRISRLVISFQPSVTIARSPKPEERFNGGLLSNSSMARFGFRGKKRKAVKNCCLLRLVCV